MKKLIIAGISLLLVIVMTVTVVLTSGLDMGVKFPDVLDRFTASIKNYTLSLSHTEGGKLNRESGEVQEGTLVDMVATPDEGYVFAGWFSANNTFLSSAPTYSFTMSEDTYLYARFSLTPDEMKGNGSHKENLRNCSQDFSFTVKCNRQDAEQYLAQNLKIVDSYFVGTEYEDLAAVEFVLTPLENGVFKVSPKEGILYEKGITYTAMMTDKPVSAVRLLSANTDTQAPQATFDALGRETTSFDFSIETAKSNIIVPRDNLVYICHDKSSSDPIISITDDGLTPGTEGDVADQLVLTKRLGLNVDDIFCVYDGTVDENGDPVLNENTLFGKVLSVENIDDNYHITYGIPELSEMFSQLDVGQTGELDLGNSDIIIDEEALVEQVRQYLCHNESFIDYIAQYEAAVAIAAEKYGYQIEMIKFVDFADMLDIKISPKIDGNKVSVSVDVSLNIAINKKGANPEQIMQVSIFYKFQTTATFNADASVKVRWKWFIPTGISYFNAGLIIKTTDKHTVGISLSYDRGSAGYADLEEHLKKEINEITTDGEKLKQHAFFKTAKDHLKEGGFKEGTSTFLRLAQFRVYFAWIFSFNITLEMKLDFDLAGSVAMTFTSTTYAESGISYSSGRLKPYQNTDATYDQGNLTFCGKVGVRAGIHVKAYLSVTGLNKYIQLGLTAGVGLYVKLEGIVTFVPTVLGGNISTGLYYTYGGYYKLFSLSGDLFNVDKEVPFFIFGYTEYIVDYIEKDDLEQNKHKIAFTKGEIDIWQLHFLRVYSMSTEDGAITAEEIDPNSDSYKVTVTLPKNSNLVYDKETGELSAKKGAPQYFEEMITLKVTHNGAWKALPGIDYSATYVRLPEITITVIYGDEDAFYAAMDTELQAAFRKLYRQYNNINDTPLKVQFSHIISNAITVSPSQADLFDRIVNTYIDKLFRHIDAIKPTDDGKRSVENSFVAVEPVAYESTMTVLNTMLKNKAVTKGEITQCLENVLKSTVMYNTVIAVSQSNDIDSLSKCFDKIDEGTKDIIMEALNQFEDDHAGNATATELAKAFRTILKV